MRRETSNVLRSWSLLLSVLCAFVWPADAVSQNVRTARISGRVLAGDIGKPLRGAQVNVVDTRAANPTQRQGRWVMTDANGSWELGDLAPGRYVLSASKSGYLKIEYGQRRPFEPGKTVEVAAGQVLEQIDVTLPRGSAITGRIFDEFGDPAAGVLVRALRHRYVDGQRVLTPLSDFVEVLVNGGGITDDLGHFRIYGLAPGDYYVSALFGPLGEPAGGTGYPPTYYPGTASAAEARRITVRVGEEAQNINLNLVSARYAVVSGTVLNSLNAPVKGSVGLFTADPTAGGHLAGTTGEGGTFRLSHVLPGEYRLRVYGARSSAGVPESASVPIAISGEDVTGIVLVTSPGATASGRVVFEDAASPGGGLFVRTSGTGAGASLFSTSVGVNPPNMTFQVGGLFQRQTFHLGMVPDGWFLKSVTREGKDITDAGYDFKPGEQVSGIEILLTRRATTLTGTVRGERGEAIGDYSIVVFSSDRSKWGHLTRFVRSARPDQDGRFTLRALPPDDYLVVALEYLESGQEFDPEQLRLWEPHATKVGLTEGGTQSISVRLVR